MDEVSGDGRSEKLGQNSLTTAVLSHRLEKKLSSATASNGKISYFVPLTVYFWVLSCTSFAILHNAGQVGATSVF